MSGKEESTSESWVDPDDAPEWTSDNFRRAAFYRGGKLVRPADGGFLRPGRPRLANPKRQVTLRLDSDVLESLRNSGPGWQSRVNEILRKAVKV